MARALFLILSYIIVENTARNLLTDDDVWVENDQFEICQSSESDLTSSDSSDLPRPRPINYDAYVHKIPTALAFAMKQKRGTGKTTDIPPELMKGIAEFIPNPLSELQQEIMDNLQNGIEAKLKTGYWDAMVTEYIADRATSYICRAERCEEGMYIDGKMSHLERNCMHQVLLARRANQYLSIQKLEDSKPAFYRYTLDGRGSYLDPAINYCELARPALYSYNYNPPILQVIEEVD